MAEIGFLLAGQAGHSPQLSGHPESKLVHSGQGDRWGPLLQEPRSGLGVLPSLPSPRLPVPPVITGSPSPHAHAQAQAHTHLHPFQQAVLPPGGQVRTSAPGSCQSLPSPLFWMPGLWPQGLQPLGLWSLNLPPPCVTKQVHFLHQAATLWNKCPCFLQPFLKGADQPWKRLRDMWFGPGPSKLVANQALPSWLPLPAPLPRPLPCGLWGAELTSALLAGWPGLTWNLSEPWTPGMVVGKTKGINTHTKTQPCGFRFISHCLLLFSHSVMSDSW